MKKKKGKELDLKEHFDQGIMYIKESKGEIYFVIAIFFISALVGFFFSERFTFLNVILVELVSKVIGLNVLELTFFILLNNIQSAFFTLLGGVFLGILPIIGALTNGIVLGYVLSLTYEVSGLLDFWRLFPHGIFELGAIFIALGMGVRLGGFVFAKQKVRELKRRFFESINVFLVIIMPLLILAAIIEGLLIFLV